VTVFCFTDELFFYHPISDLRDRRSTPVKSILVLGHRYGAKNWLRHFTHSSPNFYKGGGKKVRNLASIFDRSRLWSALLSKISNIWNKLEKRQWRPHNLPKFGADGSTQIWELVRTKSSFPRKRAGKLCLVIDNFLAGGMWVRYGSPEYVKIHFQSNPRWQMAPKLEYTIFSHF